MKAIVPPSTNSALQKSEIVILACLYLRQLNRKKIVSNPNIGYGIRTIKYADGKTQEFYQIGISGNTTGISVYILGIADKTYLARTFGKKLGKASVSGYCIKFKTLKDINMDILEAAIRYGLQAANEKGEVKNN